MEKNNYNEEIDARINGLVNNMRKYNENRKLEIKENNKELTNNSKQIAEIEARIEKIKGYQSRFQENEDMYKQYQQDIKAKEKEVLGLKSKERNLNAKNAKIQRNELAGELKPEIKEFYNQRDEIINELKEKQKNTILEKNNEIKEQEELKERLSKDVEALRKGVESEKLVAERINNTDALQYKMKKLEEKENEYAKVENNIKELKENLESDIDKELAELDSKIEFLKEINIDTVEKKHIISKTESNEKTEKIENKDSEKEEKAEKTENKNPEKEEKTEKTENKEEEDKKEALRKYEKEGYGKNADGEYYNPWTDEYDKNYDPTKDTTYMPKNAENIEQNAENQQQNISEQAQGENKKTTFRQGMGNVINAHGGGKAIAKRTAGRAIKGAAFMGKTAFKASAVAMGAAAGLASGQGIAAVVAGAKGGLTVAEKLGNSVESGVYSAYGKAKTTLTSGQPNPIGKFMDEFNGNTEHQDAAGVKAFMKEDSTDQYIRDKLSNDKGRAPTREELKAEKENIKKYADEGMTDIEQIYKAKKAEEYGVSAEQSAKIALLAQERKIDFDVLGDEKKYKQRKADFTQEFVNKGLSNGDATKKADYILNVMKAQVGREHNLEKIQQNPQQGTSKPK